MTSPDFASFDSVVETLARPRPVALATSPAVIALPFASAPSTALRVAPDAARPRDAVALVARARLRGFAAALLVRERLLVVRERDARRLVVEAGVDDAPSLDPSAVSALRSLSASASN